MHSTEAPWTSSVKEERNNRHGPTLVNLRRLRSWHKINQYVYVYIIYCGLDYSLYNIGNISIFCYFRIQKITVNGIKCSVHWTLWLIFSCCLTTIAHDRRLTVSLHATGRTILNGIRIRWAILKTHQFSMDVLWLSEEQNVRNLRSEFLTDLGVCFIPSNCSCLLVYILDSNLTWNTNKSTHCSTGFSHRVVDSKVIQGSNSMPTKVGRVFQEVLVISEWLHPQSLT